MIRISLLYLFIAALLVDAWRGKWYRSLCALVLLMAVIEHPDMPKTMLGIEGLNPWNLLFFNVLGAWALHRSRERLRWDLPRYVSVLLILYVAVILVGFVRMMADTQSPWRADETISGLTREYLFNTIKWAVPGLLLFDGCRTRRQFLMGMASLLGVYFLLALQVIKYMPPSSLLTGTDLAARSLKLLERGVGYHRVNLSTMLAGASWAIFATRELAPRPWQRLLIALAAAVTLYGQATTAGRAGYVAWAVTGLVLCLLRWRRYLFVAPLVVVLVLWLVPGMSERLLEGFSTDPMAEKAVDIDTVTADRSKIWPLVILKIKEAPLVGWGRQTMLRSLGREIFEITGEAFPHPHNAYLEWLLDNGWLGAIPVALFHLVVLFHAARLFLDGRSPVFVAAGGVTLALVLVLSIASMGSQTFYPREGAVPMWCAFGLLFRVSLERSRALAGAGPGRTAGGTAAPSPAGRVAGGAWDRRAAS